MNSEYYFLNEKSQIKVLLREDLKECKEVENLHLCNSMEMEKLENGTTCMYSALTNIRKNLNCELKNIQEKNYILRISRYSIFCHIVEPLVLRIQCEEGDNLHNLTENKEIEFERHCHAYKMIDDMNVDLIKTKQDLEFSETNFTIFTSSSNINSTRFQILNKNEITELIDEVKNTIVLEEKSSMKISIPRLILRSYHTFRDTIFHFLLMFVNIGTFFIYVLIPLFILVCIKNVVYMTLNKLKTQSKTNIIPE